MSGSARKGFLGNAAVVAALTALSRVLGLVREMFQSRLIGAGVEQSAFVLAFALPNMARKLFGEGALTAAFVPVFKGEVERGEVEAAKRLARAVLTMVLLVLGSVVVLVVLSLTAVLELSSVASGFSERTLLTLRLVRILFPYMIFICGAAFGMGVLNALGKFAEGAFMPAMLNVVWIAALALLCFLPGWSLSARATFVCSAILLGGFLQMAFLFRCMRRRGYGFRFPSPRSLVASFRAPDFRLVWRNTAIAALGSGAIQLNYMLDQVLAQCASPWAAGVVGYAERLMDLPLGVIGVAFGTVLLPTFAGCFAKGDEDGARDVLRRSVDSLMLVMIPSSVGLCVLAPLVTSVIYEGAAFDAVATVRVSRALAVYAVGLVFFGFQKSLVPWFQAQNDMKTPLRVTLATVIVNAVLNIAAVVLLPVEWRHVGLAASTVFCAALGCAILLWKARAKNGALGLASETPALVRMFFVALIMGAGVRFVQEQTLRFGGLISLSLSVFAGLVIYALPFAGRVRNLRRR